MELKQDHSFFSNNTEHQPIDDFICVIELMSYFDLILSHPVLSCLVCR